MAGSYIPPKIADTLLPDLLTFVARQHPQRPLAQVIREHADAPTDRVRFTWEQVLQHAQNASVDIRNRWAESLKDKGKSAEIAQPREPGSPLVVVAVLGNNGYALYINMIACILNRWTAVLISPKNSPAAIEHLLNSSKSSLLLLESNNTDLGYMMEEIFPDLTPQVLATLDSPAAGPAPSPLQPITKEQIEKEIHLPVFYLHTSGSTGHPKIIPWSHEFVLAGARSRMNDPEEWTGRLLYSLAPLWHSIGIIVHFMDALVHANLLNFVLSPTPRPPTASSLVAHLPFMENGIVMLVPSILVDLYNMGPEAVQKVVDARIIVMFGGAQLPTAIGDALIAAGMTLSACYGTTETNMGTTHPSWKKLEDWEYMYFREGYEWHLLPVDDHSNLRESIIGPGRDACPAVINHENPRGYETKDIWEPHPSIPNLWRHHSRKGDVTVLSNGEKSDNKQIEDLLLKDKHILFVQVFGVGRPMNGVLVQPADPSVPASEFLSQIRPTIEYANTILPKHSRLIPELVIVTPPNRPFATTDKQTVKAKETLDRFAIEIESAYDALNEGSTGLDWPFEGNVDREEDLKRFVRDAVRKVLGKEVPDQGDLFEHGLDSLLAIHLRAALLSVVKKTPTASEPVPENVVYTFPHIDALTTYLLSRVVPGMSSPKATIAERIQQSTTKYSSNLIPHVPGSESREQKVIALSGSTGSLGSSILGLILGREDVKTVYLLNRRGSESQQKRQAIGLKDRCLDSTVLDSKKENIVYLDVDLSRKDLGLSAKDYEELRDNVTHIIHAAWHLNFNLGLESYERVHIAGVRHLVDLSLASPHTQAPRLTFLSTIAAAGMYQGPVFEPSIGERLGQTLVPEAPVEDPGITLNQGYGQSKYVGERILVGAINAGLRATIVRVGQLSGVSQNGAWATTEHVPILMRSSLAVEMVPDDLSPVRWVPSDIAASIVLKQAFEDKAPLQYFSIENPFPTQWDIIVQGLCASAPKPLRRVSLAAWLEHIRKSNLDPNEVPAMKLLDFYERSARSPVALGWDRSVQLSPELAEIQITTELVEKYVQYQQTKGNKL